MLTQIKTSIRQSDTLLEDLLGCVALAVILVGMLHLPLL